MTEAELDNEIIKALDDAEKLQAENERLRAALQSIANGYQSPQSLARQALNAR